MNPKIILAAGHLAAGKTAFSLRLSRELGVPCFNKDCLKSALSERLPVRNREESKRLSAATFDALAHIAQRLMEAGQPLILESNFVSGEYDWKANEAAVLRGLIERYRYRSLTFLLVGDPRALYERFIARDNTPERGEANRLMEPLFYGDFARSVALLGDFDIGGERVTIDTTDFGRVDFDRHIETARAFLLR